MVAPGTLALPPTATVGQEAAKPAEASAPYDPYPLRRSGTVVRFFSLATEKPRLAAAAADLEGLHASLVYGPMKSSARPESCFLALQAPVGVASKDLVKALRKAGGTPRELYCVAFDGHTLTSAHCDDTLAMFSAVAWVDSAGPWTQMYLEKKPSVREVDDMVERYEMMYEQVMKLGRPVREGFTWKLAGAPDDKSSARILGAIRKLEGVVDVSLEGTSLRLVVQLIGLPASGSSGTLPSSAGTDAEGRAAPRATWPTHFLYELLASEKLLPPDTARDDSRQ